MTDAKMSELFAYYTQLRDRELSTEEDGNVIYEDELLILKNLVKEAENALRFEFKVNRKKDEDRFYDLCDTIDEIKYFIKDLESKRDI